MTIEDLREQGVLLPEEEWGSHRLETTVPQVPLAVAFLVAAAALVAAYLGDGGAATWIGVGVFLASLYAITWMVDRAVFRQRRRVRRERAEAASPGETSDGAEGPPADGGGGEEPDDGARP